MEVIMQYNALGKKFKEIRNEFAYTQKDLSILCDVSINTIRNLENGKGNITIRTIEKLSKVLKVDMFLILAQYRDIDDLLSDNCLEIIKEFFKESTSATDVTKAVAFREIKQIQPFLGSNNFLNKMINALNDIKSNELHFKEINIIELESILLTLTSDFQHQLCDPYLYDYELFIGLYLATLYRKRNCFNKSLEILMKCKDNLISLNTLTLQQNNYLGSIILNICYCYHRIGNHNKVLEEGMELLTNDKYQISRYLLTDIKIRIGIAFHFLGETKISICILQSAIFFETGERRNYRIKMLRKMYNIIIN